MFTSGILECLGEELQCHSSRFGLRGGDHWFPLTVQALQALAPYLSRTLHSGRRRVSSWMKGSAHWSKLDMLDIRPTHAAYSQVASNCTEEDSAGPCQHCLGVQAPGSVVSDHREWWLRRQGDLGMAMRRATIHSGRSSCPVHIVLCASVSVKPSGVWKSRGFGWIPHLLVPPGPEARSSTALSSFPPNTGWHDGGNEFFAARPRRPMDPGLSCYRPWLKGISRHRRRSILCIAQNAPISLRGGRTSSVGCW